MTKTLEELDAAANAALSKAAAARDAVEQARAEAEARRQERLEAHDRKVLAAWDRVPLERDVTAAKLRLKQAIEVDPTWGAIIDVLVAEHRRYQQFHAASGLSAKYGKGEFSNPPSPTNALTFDTLANVCDQLASQVVADEMDARDQDRTAAGEANNHTDKEKT